MDYGCIKHHNTKAEVGICSNTTSLYVDFDSINFAPGGLIDYSVLEQATKLKQRKPPQLNL